MRLADFGQLMRRYRMAHGLTQEQLAEILGVQSKYISFLENGHRDPSAAIQRKMENLLLEDELSKTLIKGECIATTDELAVLLTLFHKLCRVHPMHRRRALEMVYQILDSMTRGF